MLSIDKQNEIKEHLEKAQNPLFYYDNDADGLCSFLLFRRFLGRGKGVAVRSYPDLSESYAKKAEELNADYVFILDKPVLSREFLKSLSDMQIPVVWLDHHDLPREDFSEFTNFYSYNPSWEKEKSSEPITYIAQKICNKKEDEWIAVMGCIADHYMPDFASEFAKQHPEFWGKSIKKPFDAYYKTEIGKLAQALNFGLKDSISNVVQMQNYLLVCKSPADVLAENVGNHAFRNKYAEMRKRYESLLKEAKKELSGKILFFEYGGESSISSDLSNELSYLYPGVLIAVAFKKGGISNISLRGKNVKRIFDKIRDKLSNASGGGHEEAIGARIESKDLKVFKELLLEEIV